MKMDGESSVRAAAVDPNAMEQMGREQEQAVGGGIVMFSLHQIIHIAFQKEIDLIEIVAMQGIFRGDIFRHIIAVADLLGIHGKIGIHAVPPGDRYAFARICRLKSGWQSGH